METTTAYFLNASTEKVLEMEEEAEEKFIFDNMYVRIVLFLLYSIVFVLCFFGNLAVVLVMALHWKMRNITKFCLGNLAFANLCVGVFCVYQNLTMYLINKWIFGDLLCKLYHFTNSLSHTASILILVVISVERYLAILHPFKCRRFLTIQRLKLIILGVWVVSAVICLPRLYYIQTIRHPYFLNKSGDSGSVEMICVPVTSLYDSVTADMIHFVILFLLPLLIITGLYAKIGFHLRKRDMVNTAVSHNPFGRPSCSDGGDVSEVTLNMSEALGCNNHFRSLSIPSTSMYLTSSCGTQIGQPQTCQQSSTLTDCGNPCDNLSRTSSSGSGISNNITSGVSSNLRLHRLTPNSTLIRINFSRSQRRRPGDAASCGSIFSHTPTITSCPRPHKAVVRMLSIVVISFAVCNLPFHLRKLYQNFWPEPGFENELTELVAPITFLMMYANCAINPLLYAFMSKSFRSSFKDILRCKLRKNPTGSRNQMHSP